MKYMLNAFVIRNAVSFRTVINIIPHLAGIINTVNCVVEKSGTGQGAQGGAPYGVVGVRAFLAPLCKRSWRS